MPLSSWGEFSWCTQLFGGQVQAKQAVLWVTCNSLHRDTSVQTLRDSYVLPHSHCWFNTASADLQLQLILNLGLHCKILFWPCTKLFSLHRIYKIKAEQRFIGVSAVCKKHHFPDSFPYYYWLSSLWRDQEGSRVSLSQSTASHLFGLPLVEQKQRRQLTDPDVHLLHILWNKLWKDTLNICKRNVCCLI